MRKKYLLLFFVFEVFVFLIVTMIYSYNTIDNINAENSRILSLFSRIQSNLVESHVNHESYIIQKQEKEFYEFNREISELELNILELNERLVSFVDPSGERINSDISSTLDQANETFNLFIKTSREDLKEVQVNRLSTRTHLLYEQSFSVAGSILTKLKLNYLKIYANSQKQLSFLESIRIGVTLLLLFALLVWVFVYMRKNDKYQKSLIEFNERYKAYFDKTHEGIFRVEFREPIDIALPPEKQAELYYEHGFVAECNQSFARMYGAESPTEIVGMSIIDFYGLDNFKKNFNDTIELAKNAFNVEKQITIENDRKGNINYFSNNSFGIVEDDCIRRIWGTQRDVTTEMLEAEEKKILLRAVEQSQVSIIITDLNGKIEYVNPKFEEVTGYSVNEVIGENPKILKSGLDYDAKYKELWDTISKGKTWTGTLHNKKKNGELFFESTIITPITDETGRIRYFVAVKEDITELTKAQHELQNYKEYLEDLVEKRTRQLENRTVFLRTLIDTIPNPVFVKDTQGKYTDVNEAFLDFFKVEPSELLGKDVSFLLSEKIKETTEIIDKELLEKPGMRTYELCGLDSGDKKVDVRIFKASFGPAEGKPEGIVGLMVDISDSKRTEEQMKKALEQEKELNEMKNNFISMASHELRTPLTAIYSSTELIEMHGRKWPEKKYAEHISKIKYSVDNLINLMEDLLTLSKVDTGLIKFNPTSFNLKSFVEKMIANLESLSLDSHQLSVEINLKNDYYILDKKLINYIVQNLLSNAFKYSPEGGPVKLIMYDDDKNIHFKIKDEGIGIADDELGKLFEPFYRAHNATEITGTGLGLSIVKDAVDLFNGKIKVQSVENEWTEFEIVLPIIKEIS